MIITNSGGDRLHVAVLGEGPPVLLLPGAVASGRYFTHFGLAPLLARDFRVILPDLTGMGASARVEKVSPTQWCEDVLSVLEALGLDRVHLGGVSLGSRIAGRFALEHPGRVLTLLADSPIVAVDPAGEAFLARFFAHPDEAPEHARAGWLEMHGEDWRDVLAFYARTRADQALQEYLTLRPHLAAIVAPTLITRGDLDDRAHPLAQALEWHSAAAGSWLWIAPGARASATARDVPDQLAQVYRSFLARAASVRAVGQERHREETA